MVIKLTKWFILSNRYTINTIQTRVKVKRRRNRSTLMHLAAKISFKILAKTVNFAENIHKGSDTQSFYSLFFEQTHGNKPIYEFNTPSNDKKYYEKVNSTNKCNLNFG